MRITLRLERLADAPKSNGGKSRVPALGWSTPSDGTIHIVRGFTRLFFGFGRRIHEAEHFTSGLGNEMHAGHDWHFCGRSWHAIRLFPRKCTSWVSWRVASALVRDGSTIDV